MSVVRPEFVFFYTHAGLATCNYNSGILILREASIYTARNCSELCINQTQRIVVHISLCSLAHVEDIQCIQYEQEQLHS